MAGLLGESIATRIARWRGPALGGVLAAALMAAPGAAAQADPYAPKWNPWVEFGGLGGDDGRGIIEFWTPLMQSSNALFFFDGRFQFIRT